MASLGDDSDPSEDMTGDLSSTNQFPIKLELAFSKQDEARHSGQAGSSAMVVVGEASVTPS